MKHDSWLLKNAAVLFAVPVILLSLALLCFSVPGVQRGMASPRWPATDGTVTGLDVEQRALSIGRFEPRVTYSYMIDGIAYDSDRIWPLTGVQYATYNQSDAFLKDYPGGGRIRVYYDPNRPATSVLVPGARDMDLALLGIGGILLLAGLALLIEHFRDSRKKD